MLIGSQMVTPEASDHTAITRKTEKNHQGFSWETKTPSKLHKRVVALILGACEGQTWWSNIEKLFHEQIYCRKSSE